MIYTLNNVLMLLILLVVSYYEFYLIFKDNGYILQKSLIGYTLPLEIKNIDMIKLSFNSLYKYSFPFGELIVFSFPILFSIVSLILFYETNIIYYLYFFIFSFLHFFIPYYFLYIREYNKLFKLGFKDIESWIESKYSDIEIDEDFEELVFLLKDKCNMKKYKKNIKKIKANNTSKEKYVEFIKYLLSCINTEYVLSLFDEEKTKKYFFRYFFHIDKYNFIIVDKYEQPYLIILDKQKVYIKKVSFKINKKYFSFYKINNIYHSILARSIESLFLISFYYFYVIYINK